MIENMFGTLIYVIITSFREIVEAALIIGIIQSYLTKTNRLDLKGDLLKGIFLAIISSVLLAIFITAIFVSFEEYEPLFEGGIMLLASGVLTWMIFWMWKQSRSVKNEIEEKLTFSITTNQKNGIVLLVFFTVFRELAELLLFIYAAFAEITIQIGLLDGSIVISIGLLIGLVLASGLYYFIFNSTKKVNLKKFFNITSVILIIFAAGLLIHGIHEIYEFLEINNPNITNIVFFKELYDINTSPVGELLKIIFGWSYDPNYPNQFGKSLIGGILSVIGWQDSPIVLEFVLYFSYIILIILTFNFLRNEEEKSINSA